MKLYITFFLFLTTTCIQAQTSQRDSTSTNCKRAVFGVRAGIMTSGFTHNSAIDIPYPSIKNAINWHAGITSDFSVKNNYATRIELNYLSKGAREQFSNDKIAIDSRNTLSYIQLHILPVILKTKLGNTTPYLALGGFYAHRIKIASKWKTGSSWENDEETPKILNRKNDFGYSVSLGIRTKHGPHVEFRYEAGLKSISSVGSVKNRSIILAVSI